MLLDALGAESYDQQRQVDRVVAASRFPLGNGEVEESPYSLEHGAGLRPDGATRWQSATEKFIARPQG